MFGLSEVAIILVVVILVLAAKKLPDLARSAGKSARILKAEAAATKDEAGRGGRADGSPRHPWRDRHPGRDRRPEERCSGRQFPALRGTPPHAAGLRAAPSAGLRQRVTVTGPGPPGHAAASGASGTAHVSSTRASASRHRSEWSPEPRRPPGGWPGTGTGVA